MQTFIASIFVFGVLILVHELGHFFAARLTGIRVLELAIGFGPRVFGWRKNNTDFSLRAFPLGGFCRMLGESPEEAEEPDSFPQKPILSRALVLLSGAGMNLLLAIAVFFVIFFFFVGVPDTTTATIGYVIEESPAEAAGLQTGDLILQIDGVPVQKWDDVLQQISGKPQQELHLVIEREGAKRDLRVVSELVPDSGRGVIGIGPEISRYSFIASLTISFQRFGAVIASIYMVISGQAPLDVAGPVGIVYVIGEVAQTGFVNLLLLTALISISLGIMNLLPIPALDGGRLLFLIVEAIRGRRIDPEKEGFVHFIGFALLILLILFVTYQDLLRFVFPQGD